MKKIIGLFMAAICFVCICSCGTVKSPADNGGDKPAPKPPAEDKYTEPEYDEFEVTQDGTVYRLQSTDANGRYFTEVDGFDKDKKVGIFYFLWIGQHDQKNAGADGCSWDSSLLSETELKANTEVGVFHYWNKPLYDYYNSEDPWVFRKHLELFVMAGIDYLVFDVSNSYYYKKVCDNIFPVAVEYAEQGWKIPKFIFYCHTKTKSIIMGKGDGTDADLGENGIYKDFYDPNNPALRKYDCLWYTEEDNGERNIERKPWIIVKNNGKGDEASQNFSECSKEVKDFFYTRELRWSGEHAADAEWVFPSDIDDPIEHKGMLSVSVAQHTSGAFSDSVFENGRRDSNRGRGWDNELGTNVESNIYFGTNYEGEWERAFKQSDKVNNIFLSTWNEWVAQKQMASWGGRSSSYFVDQFNPEFSRDIEMTADLWGDNYYLQTVFNARRFKQVSDSVNSAFLPRRTEIDINTDDERWNGTVGYLDFAGDTKPRNYKSSNLNAHGNVPNVVYTNTTGRNDIVKTNVTCDDKNMYFRIECDEDITAYEAGDKTWMNILIEIEGLKGNNWENYQFVINRTVDGKKTAVERLKRNGSSESIAGYGEFNVRDNVMTVAVPREFIGLADKESFTMNFKVADHVTNYTDIMDYYVNGDSAPIGRLNYTFGV